MSEITHETTSTPLRIALPQRWLSMLAALVVVGVVGAVALSVGIWVSEGSPQVSAQFGMANRGPGPGQGGPGGGPGGQPGQGNFNNGPQGGPNVVPQGGQNPGAIPGQQGPGGQPNQQPQNPNANVGSGILSRSPDFVGSLRSATDRSITINTPQGQRVIQLTSDTVIYRADGSIGSIIDIERNQNLAVVLAQGRNPLTASEVLLLR